jgi:hypothetical protein
VTLRDLIHRKAANRCPSVPHTHGPNFEAQAYPATSLHAVTPPTEPPRYWSASSKRWLTEDDMLEIWPDVPIVCPTCRGSGLLVGDCAGWCRTCQGTGIVGEF